ncbi:Hypothetical predicted protein [Mytilus galloprovincialis]|uniref:Uncharacterized protein n=1 Tax=Mytilus galloprovincialis TaxID=29158 RepID=A0A8B6BP14_MYTGA|nr:Hypothetical predicted protein [Mytilus galloprovincialis]
MAGASADQTDRTGMTPIEVIIRSQKILEKSYYVSKTDKDLCSKVSILLEHGANPNIKESDQDSFLILAAERLLPLVVSKLLEYGANVNHTGQCKRTALHKVLLAETKYSSTVRHEALQIIDALLASQASVDIVDKEGNTPLLIAIQRESVDAVERLLKSAPNLSYQGKNKCNAYDMSLLCKSAPLKILNALLEHKNIGEKVGLFFMKFWEFIQKEKCRDKQLIEKIMLKIVCEKNLNVNIANRLKDSPLIYFTKLRSIDVVKLFIKMKADVNHVGEKGMTALHHAVMDTKTAIPLLDCLLKEHPLLDLKDQDQETPLTKVFKHLNKGYFYERDEFTEVCYILRRLLDAGAFSSQDDLNKALVTVAKKGDFVTMKSLVSHGANKHVLDNHSNTVLHLCWCEDLDGAVDFIRYYKEQGGKLDSLNEKGYSPLMSLLKKDVHNEDKLKTRDREIDKITLCFLEFNSMVCVIPNKKGNSALHFASKHGYIKTMETLLTHGCDPFSRNDVGNTPLHAALTSRWYTVY